MYCTQCSVHQKCSLIIPHHLMFTNNTEHQHKHWNWNGRRLTFIFRFFHNGSAPTLSRCCTSFRLLPLQAQNSSSFCERVHWQVITWYYTTTTNTLINPLLLYIIITNSHVTDNFTCTCLSIYEWVNFLL